MTQDPRVVLIVNSASEDRKLYQRCLLHGEHTYIFLEAATGVEGLTLWRQQPDIVLLDYCLSDMDGLEFITRLAEASQPLCPIIMITGVGNESIAVQAIKSGAQDYLVKDQVTPGRLQLTVDNAIKAVQQQQRIEQDRLALQESEERFRQLAENIGMAFWVTELPERRVSYVSPAYESLWGLAIQDIYDDYRAWINLLHPDDRSRVDKAFEEKATKRQFDEEYRIILPDGTQRWIRDRCFPIRDPSGKTYRLTGIAADITEQKQSEQALQESEYLLRLAMDSAHAGSWTWEFSTGKIVWSPENYDLYGLDPAQGSPQYEDWSNALHPDDRDRANAEVARVIEHQLPEFRAEFRIVHPQRGIRWIQGIGCLELDDHGQPLRLSGINLDITERKQTEACLADNEARLQGFVDANVVGILYGDIYGNVYRANDELLRIVGYTRADLEAGQLRWLDITPLEYLPLDEETITEAQAKGACTPYEKEYIRKDGSRIPVLVGYSLLGEAREEAVAFVLDLTERKRVEKSLRRSKDRLRMAIESAELGTWDWHLTSNKLILDSGCKAMFGLPPDSKVSLDIFFEGLHPEDRDRVKQAMEQSLTPGYSGSFNIEYRTVGIQDGVERWLLAKGQAYFNDNNQPQRFIGTVMDVTDRKQAETDIKRAEAQREYLLQREQEARAEAERANRIKDEFLAILSHELRSPLNPILGWSKLLQMRKLDEAKTAQALETIERNAKLQTQLIDDLLDIARILRGKLKLENIPLSLPSAIEAAIETVRTAAEVKSISIHADLPDIGQIIGDTGRIQQIVWNLLSNAIKFTPKNGRVEIQLEQVNDQAQLTVTDTGKGISPDFLPHIFQSFRQEDASITRQHGGLGLGLAIVNYLVEAHGGTISVDSPGEGQGSIFTVRFPLINNSADGQPAGFLSNAEVELVGIRILAVDDSPDARELLTTLLTQYQVKVMIVATAAEVLANLDTFRPDVLVCDIGMPDMDGYGLMESIRALPSEKGGQVPAIALTAYVRETDQQRTLDCGYQRHLAKPIDVDKLLQAISTLARAEG